MINFDELIRIFLLFMIYSHLGYFIEIVNGYIKTKKFVNRGFLRGPYLPIYGIGGLLIYLTLSKYIDDPLAVFIIATFEFAILEYVTSYGMEKFFNARWWDYSDRPYNINGRIVLTNIGLFGLLGLVVMYLINPWLISVINQLPNILIFIVSIVFLIIFITDYIVSFNMTFKIRNVLIPKRADASEMITKRVDLEIKKLIKKYPTLETFFKKEA